jgi:hypothetical protein
MGLSDELVVVAVSAYPKPEHSIGSLLADGSVVPTDADRPVLTDFLEMQRWVPRVGFQQGKRSVGQFLNGGR